MNLGERRRKDKAQLGFVLDLERGYWKPDKDLEDEDYSEDPMSPNTARVIPYVEDHRNCLLFKPVSGYDEGVMASLQAALKTAIQVEFQLEEAELAAEPLPDSANRKLILFYEQPKEAPGPGTTS